jgi:hypothetical protein
MRTTEHDYTVTEGGKIYWSRRNALGQFCRADGTNRSQRGWALAEWHQYCDARYYALESATRGIFKTRAGRRSQELHDWFETNDPTLTFTAFYAMIVERQES